MKLSNEIRYLYRVFEKSGDFLDFYQQLQIGVTVANKNLSRFLDFYLSASPFFFLINSGSQTKSTDVSIHLHPNGCKVLKS